MRRREWIAGLVVASASGGQVQDELAERMNEFCLAYNDFVHAMTAGIFDQRQARRLSRLWRRIETSGNWPQ